MTTSVTHTYCVPMKRFTDVQTDLSGRVGGFAAVVESKSSLHYVKESVFSVCAAVAVKPLGQWGELTAAA